MRINIWDVLYVLLWVGVALLGLALVLGAIQIAEWVLT